MICIRIALLAVLLTYSLLGYTQSERSNELYAEAVALYEQGQYLQAIPLLKEAYEHDLVELDSLNERRHSCRQWIASAYYKVGQGDSAKYYDQFAYSLPPIDRRLTVVSDSLGSAIRPAFDANRYEDALNLAMRMAALEQQNLGGETWFSLNSKNTACLLLYALGRESEAEQLMESNISALKQIYGDKCPLLAFFLRDALSIYDAMGNLPKWESSGDQLIRLLTDIDEQNSQFAEGIYAGMCQGYMAVGNFAKLDAIHALQQQRVVALYGKNSVEYGNLLRTMASQNLKLKRAELALTQATESERLLKMLEGRMSESRVLALINKAMAKAELKDLKSARKDLSECLKCARKIQNPEVISVVLSSLMAFKSVDGKNTDDSMLNEVQAMLEKMEREGNRNQIYSIGTIMLAQTLAYNERIHDAAVLVGKNLTLFEQQNQYQFLILSSFLLLLDNQYVKARQASSRGLELLNIGLLKAYNAVLVKQCKGDVYLALKLVETKSNGHVYVSDTTSYSLALIRQDLLQAKLAILSHEDSLGTPDFMDALTEYAWTATNMTHDKVMADSIIDVYTKRLFDVKGGDSPEYLYAVDLKDRCAFEAEGDGRVKAIMLKLHEDDDDAEIYQQLVDDYNKAYEAWKARDKTVKVNDKPAMTLEQFKIYKPPYVRDGESKEYLQTIADSCLWALNHCESLLPSYDSERDEDISYYVKSLITTWSHCSYLLEDQNQIVSLLRKWHYLLLNAKVRSKSYLLTYTLYTAWRFGDKQDYAGLEDELLEAGGEPCLEEHAAIIMEAIEQEGFSLDNSFFKCALTELDSTIQVMRRQSDDRNLTYQKYYIIRTMMLWGNYWYYGLRSRNDLLDDFRKIYDMLVTYPDLRRCRESFNAMNMFCSITTNYSTRNNELTILADKMRQTIRQACISFMKDYQISRWPTISPLGGKLNFYIRVRYDEDNLEKLERDIQYAYQEAKRERNSSSQEQYESLMASWQEIREKQKDTFSDSQELMKKLGTLSDEVCRYLENSNVSDTIRGMAYDIALFSKGYLLRSEQQLRKVLLQSGNRTILQQYDEYLNILNQLGNSTLTDKEVSELTSKSWSLWYDLRSDSKMFDDYTKSLETSWRDVQAILNDDEVAIEFICSNESLKTYYALILRKGYDAPMVVRVGWESLFLEKGDKMYTSEGRYSNPWPYYYDRKDSLVVPPLEGVRKIYVSPTGVLHQISIESVHDLYTDSVMADKYQIYRLSSTRELIGQRHTALKKNLTLYGGINYRLNANEWDLLAATKSNDEKQMAMRSVPQLNRAAVQTALKPLPGTAKEVRNITDLLAGEDRSVQCMMGSHATEDHFKLLSGTNVNIIHVATHGFYQTEQASEDSLAVSFERKDRSSEANALSRSGLFMAGASAVLEEEPIPSNVDDGVLTALEISHLDFTNVNLIALSACETGLGDITGDGVFGLQRGFKKAGAQSILMSLWKVDDEATCLLMTEFYKHWIGEGKTKHEALQLAMQTVRSHKEKGWNDPKYWAAFILLDALD